MYEDENQGKFTNPVHNKEESNNSGDSNDNKIKDKEAVPYEVLAKNWKERGIVKAKVDAITQAEEQSQRGERQWNDDGTKQKVNSIKLRKA